MERIKRVAIYARVSTKDQDPTNQLIDLRKYVEQRGWTVISEFVDHGVSGSKDSRPQLNALMNLARKRKLDCVLVWRFDRYARSTQHLLRSLEEFRSLGIDFVSYNENLDTSSPLGQAVFTIVSAMAQLERDIIKERVYSGLRRAKNLGKRLGRPQLQYDRVRLLKLKSEGLGLRAIGKELGISKDTVCKALSENPPSKTIV